MNGPAHVEVVQSPKGLFDYFTHAENKDKTQYDVNDIEVGCGFNLDKFLVEMNSDEFMHEVVDSLFDGIQLKHLDDIIMQKKIDKYSESHSKKTVKELVLKIRGSLKCAYARGLITNDFGHLLKSKGKELPKRNIPLSVTEFKKLRQYCLNHAEEDEFNVLVALALKLVLDVANYLVSKKKIFLSMVLKLGALSAKLMTIHN